MIAAKWMDMVVGVDIHYVLVPAPPSPAPIPTPLPHPFTGVVFDPAGLIVGALISAASSVALGTPFQGPVLVNSMPAASTGTDCTNKIVMPHFPMPPGVAWAPIPAAPKPPIPGKPPSPPMPTPVPSNDGIIVTGSKTVYFSGTNAARLGSMVMTCAEPVRLPSSTVIAIPMGAPVLVGGPPALDFIAVLMGMIRTQWVASRLHALVNRIRSARLRNLLHRLVCLMTGHPVDVMTGKVVTEFVDFQLPGYIPFKFERVYYSTSTYEGPLGHGWHHSYDQHIRIEDSYIVLRAEDGREIDFDLIEEGQTARDPIEVLELTRTKDGFVLRTKDRLKLYFGPRGRADGSLPLLRIVDPNGNEINLNYDSSGHLIEVIDSTGRHIRFINDAMGRLVALSAPRPDGEGYIDVARFQYDENNDLVAAYDALGHAYRYKYKYHLLVQETNRNGLSFYFEYDGIDEDAWCVRTWGDGGIYDHVITYDKEKHITVVENSLGAKTVYYGNEFGLVTKIIDALGGQTLYEWDEYCRKTSWTNAKGETVKYEYDSRGNLCRVTNPLGYSESYTYDENDLEVQYIDANGNRWLRERDSRGNLVSSEDPLGNKWRFRYDSRGSLRELQSPLGLTYQWEYDRSGNIIAEIDWCGNASRFTNDSWGNPIEATDALGYRTNFVYDNLNRLREIRMPNGSSALFEYDPEGNLVRFRDGNGNEMRMSYGGRNQRTALNFPSGNKVQFRYDTEENLVEVINGKGEIYSFSYDALGYLVQEVTYDGRTIRYERDLAGLPKVIIDSSGKKIKAEYDSTGRIVKENLPDGTEVRYEYDAKSNMIAVDNGTVVTRFDRDPYGRVIRESQGDWEVISNYDPIGNRIWRETSLTGRTSFRYDGNGYLLEIKHDGARITFERDPMGQEIHRGINGNISIESRYDGLGRLKQRTLGVYDEINGKRQLRSWDFEYDMAWNLIKKRDSHWGDTTYYYNEDNCLVKAMHPTGRVEIFGYDPDWNIFPIDEQESTFYSAGDQLMRYGSISFKYDKDGRVSEKQEIVDAEVVTLNFVYDGEGQIRDIIHSKKNTIHYTYDALGRRISKTVDNKTTYYFWDGDSLCHVMDESGRENGIYLFEPGTFEPLCRIDDKGAQYYVTDHLGTPIVLIDEAGQYIWESILSVWGEELEEKQDAEDQPIRFPGQYFDAETGLNYNRFRYYDPACGRYITPDPLGLTAGVNLYRYCTNPIIWYDPFGLLILIGDENPGTTTVADSAARRAAGGAGPVVNNLSPGSLAGVDHLEVVAHGTRNGRIMFGGRLMTADEFARELYNAGFRGSSIDLTMCYGGRRGLFRQSFAQTLADRLLVRVRAGTGPMAVIGTLPAVLKGRFVTREPRTWKACIT